MSGFALPSYRTLPAGMLNMNGEGTHVVGIANGGPIAWGVAQSLREAAAPIKPAPYVRL